MSKQYDKLKQKFEELQNRFKNNKDVKIVIKDTYVRFDYLSSTNKLFLNVDCKVVNNIWIGDSEGYSIIARGDLNLVKDTMNLNDFREDNPIYKIGDYLKKIPLVGSNINLC